MLRTVGIRLKVIADDAGGTVAPLGGDEYALMLPISPAAGSIGGSAATISQEVVGPMNGADTEITIEVCVGAALFPCPFETGLPATADDYAELMKQADMALHAAKQEAPETFRPYSSEFDDWARNPMARRQSLKSAIAEEQFELHYQPLVELESGRIICGKTRRVCDLRAGPCPSTATVYVVMVSVVSPRTNVSAFAALCR